MRRRKTVGILTDASKTFRMTLENQIVQAQYDKLSEEFKTKKQSFLDFLGGNFQEVITLVRELSPQLNISVWLYIDRRLFVPENHKISPYQIMNPNTLHLSSDFDQWIRGKNAFVISLCADKLKEFLDFYGRKLIHSRKLCIILTGKNIIKELTKNFQESFTFLERKGVARFGTENRRKILALLR